MSHFRINIYLYIISDGFVKTKIFDKRDDFDIDIVNFPFLDGDVPRSTSYGVYILNLFVLFECPVMSMTLIHDVIVVAVLLFYVYGKHLRSCRDGQLP